jgi:hypothetical protein
MSAQQDAGQAQRDAAEQAAAEAALAEAERAERDREGALPVDAEPHWADLHDLDGSEPEFTGGYSTDPGGPDG